MQAIRRWRRRCWPRGRRAFRARRAHRALRVPRGARRGYRAPREGGSGDRRARRSPRPTVRSGVIEGHCDEPAACAPTIAAPVGVTSSKADARVVRGRPRRHSTVAGAGSGRTPWRALMRPCPIGSGETTSSAPRWSSAAALPTMSTIASMPPTSWKCTSSIGIRCTLPRTRRGAGRSPARGRGRPSADRRRRAWRGSRRRCARAACRRRARRTRSRRSRCARAPRSARESRGAAAWRRHWSRRARHPEVHERGDDHVARKPTGASRKRTSLPCPARKVLARPLPCSWSWSCP